MFCIPIAREIVTQTGRPSGTAATVRDTAIRRNCNHTGSPDVGSAPLPVDTPITKINILTERDAIPSLTPKSPSFFFKGESPASTPFNVSANCPILVFIPVFSTIPLPLPCVTSVPMYSIFVRVSSLLSSSLPLSVFVLGSKSSLFISSFGFSIGVGSVDFRTVIDSPVSDASLTCKSCASISLMSAAPVFPVLIITMSPGTISVPSIVTISPSLNTSTCATTSEESASRAAPAPFSWTAPRMAFPITITIIATPAAN
mmetsp:Transcript_962/g.1507  ORF Transcript_962/g.1507 Transcript_962/m.1507 type:complete len:258 (+) Transcript_962:2821-3594(+)